MHVLRSGSEGNVGHNPMRITIDDRDAVIRLEEKGSGTRRIVVEMKDPGAYSPRLHWDTQYPPELIKAILEVKGAAWLCDEIARDEDPLYVRSDLMMSLLSYVRESDFVGKLVLDFGCGSGASTVIIARMFPRCRVLGVELDERLLELARLRIQHYRLDNVDLLRSPAADRIPEQALGVDFILLSAVWEHLLPAERPLLLLQMWESLKLQGVLFVNQTPDARFPMEAHTTRLPLLNYLPDRVALWCAHRFARTVSPTAPWASLLKMGIRGGTPGEILGILSQSPCSPVLLQPKAHGITRQSDIYYRSAQRRLHQRYRGVKRACIVGAFELAPMWGIPIAPYVSLAIRKSRGVSDQATKHRTEV